MISPWDWSNVKSPVPKGLSRLSPTLGTGTCITIYIFLRINVTEKNFCHIWNRTHNRGTNHLAHKSRRLGQHLNISLYVKTRESVCFSTPGRVPWWPMFRVWINVIWGQPFWCSDVWLNIGHLSQDGIVSQRSNILIKVEFTKNVIWRPQDPDFSFERIQ